MSLLFEGPQSRMATGLSLLSLLFGQGRSRPGLDLPVISTYGENVTAPKRLWTPEDIAARTGEDPNALRALVRKTRLLDKAREDGDPDYWHQLWEATKTIVGLRGLRVVLPGPSEPQPRDLPPGCLDKAVQDWADFYNEVGRYGRGSMGEYANWAKREAGRTSRSSMDNHARGRVWNGHDPVTAAPDRREAGETTAQTYTRLARARGLIQ